MLLEREDINPNLENTGSGQTPISYAANNGHEGIVRMLLERNDICTDIRDKENQTPLSLALSQGHYQVARMISERADTESNTAGPINQASLSPSTEDREDHIVETQLGDDHPNTADPIRQPTPPPGDPNTPEGVPDREVSIPNSADSTIPSTEPPSQAQPPLPWPLKFWHSLRKIATRLRTPC